MKKLWAAYLNLGIKDDYSDYQKRRVRFVNLGISGLILLLILLSVVDYYEQIRNIQVFHFIRIASLCISLLLLYTYRYYLSIYLSLIIFFVVTVWGAHKSEVASSFHIIFFPLCIISFYLTKNLVWNIIVFALSIFFYLQIHAENATKLPIANVGHSVAIFTIFFTIFLMLYLYIYEYRYYKKTIDSKNESLAKANKKLSDQNEILLKQAEEVKELIDLKDKFISVIAHDLRNPINQITGFSQILLKKYPNLSSEKIHKYLSIISAGSINSSTLLENLLHWSRSHNKKIAINTSLLQLKPFLDSIIDNHKIDAELKDIKISNNCKEDISVKTDEILLRIICRNILINAIKFSKKNSEVIIEISNSTEYLSISITDTGIGITKNKLSLILNSSKPLESSKGTAEEIGTGLGLILCRDFTKKLGGKLEIHSIENEGTTVIVNLPKHIDEPTQHPKTKNASIR